MASFFISGICSAFLVRCSCWRWTITFLLGALVFSWSYRYQLSEFSLSRSNGSNSKEIKGSEGSQAIMEEQGAYDNRAREIFDEIDRHIKAQLNNGMLWQKLASKRTGGMSYSMHRLVAPTVTDHSSESDNIPQADGEYHFMSGLGLRCITQDQIYHWQLENVWDNVDINHIRVGENSEWHPLTFNCEGHTRILMEENTSVLWRLVKDWSRRDGNILSMQFLWSGNFSASERVLQLLQDVNNADSIQILFQKFTFHTHLREQYVARYETNHVAGGYAAADSCVTVIISEELVSTIGGDGDGSRDGDGDRNGLLCAICHEMIFIGLYAKQLPCNHVFHVGCTTRWFCRQLSCPLCRYDKFR